jgi:hypothetical protein
VEIKTATIDNVKSNCNRCAKIENKRGEMTQHSDRLNTGQAYKWWGE